jgi:hypothetical protein
MELTTRRLGVSVALAAIAGCGVVSPEHERRRFDCGGMQVVVSTQQRMPKALGGEEWPTK